MMNQVMWGAGLGDDHKSISLFVQGCDAYICLAEETPAGWLLFSIDLEYWYPIGWAEPGQVVVDFDAMTYTPARFYKVGPMVAYPPFH